MGASTAGLRSAALGAGSLSIQQRLELERPWAGSGGWEEGVHAGKGVLALVSTWDT